MIQTSCGRVKMRENENCRKTIKGQLNFDLTIPPSRNATLKTLLKMGGSSIWCLSPAHLKHRSKNSPIPKRQKFWAATPSAALLPISALFIYPGKAQWRSRISDGDRWEEVGGQALAPAHLSWLSPGGCSCDGKPLQLWVPVGSRNPKDREKVR